MDYLYTYPDFHENEKQEFYKIEHSLIKDETANIYELNFEEIPWDLEDALIGHQCTAGDIDVESIRIKYFQGHGLDLNFAKALDLLEHIPGDWIYNLHQKFDLDIEMCIQKYNIKQIQ